MACFAGKALLLAAWMTTASSSALGSSPPKLLLISFDGFGWNFLSKLPKAALPHFEEFINMGVHVRWVENVFPTVTRPNHMSMVSGLYAEGHGIVGNTFYDPIFDDYMPDPGKIKDSKWVDMGAEPIWVTNSKAGGERRSGTVYWPCTDSQAKIKDTVPEEIRDGEWTVKETSKTGYERIDLALEWLTRKNDTLNFVAVYMNEPDDTSHKYGPDSYELLRSICSRDEIVGHLLEKMTDLNLHDTLNVIITADHGQQAVFKTQLIDLSSYNISSDWYHAYPDLEGGQPMANIWPNSSEKYKAIVEALNKSIPNLHININNSDFSNMIALNYSANRRIAPIVLYAEPGWLIGDHNTQIGLNGQHGWDPRYAPSMYPFFIAKGPAFHSGIRDAAPFKIVDIYPLMCYVLGLIPAPNNGSLGNVEHIVNLNVVHDLNVVHEAGSPQHSNYTAIGIGMLVLIIMVVVVVVIVRYVRQSRNVTASYKRSFARAGTGDDLIADEGTVILSDDEL